MGPAEDQHPEEPAEIALVGDLSDQESDITEKLLSVPAEGECVLYLQYPFS